jgi:hypothetical protein
VLVILRKSWRKAALGDVLVSIKKIDTVVREVMTCCGGGFDGRVTTILDD